jgi:hypothetical protein
MPVRIANRADAHITIKDVPAFVGGVGRAAAGEFGHGRYQSATAPAEQYHYQLGPGAGGARGYRISVGASNAAAMGGVLGATTIGFVSAFSRLPVHPANTKTNSRAMILIRAIPILSGFQTGETPRMECYHRNRRLENMIRAKQGKRKITPYVWVHPDEER